MDLGNFVGGLIGVTVSIWFLFYRNREMQNPKKWGLSLMFAPTFFVSHVWARSSNPNEFLVTSIFRTLPFCQAQTPIWRRTFPHSTN